jgi:hypothetical protein
MKRQEERKTRSDETAGWNEMVDDYMFGLISGKNVGME